MNIELFNTKLLALITECGAELTAPVQITPVGSPKQESYGIGQEELPLSFQAVRTTQEFNIDIKLRVIAADKWQHVSGDPRKLHPDINKPKSNQDRLNSIVRSNLDSLDKIDNGIKPSSHGISVR